jgi:hypothetical protein
LTNALAYGVIQLSVNSDISIQLLFKEIKMTIVSKSLTSKVIKLFHGEGETLAKIRATQDQAIQAVLDAMLIACDKPKAEFMKGNAKTNPARAEVKEMFDGIVSATCSKASATQYQSAFWIAFEKGIPFSRDLVNKKSDDKKTESTPKAGKVESTTMESLTATLQKALHQCVLLNQTILKGALLDAILETIPDFVETPAK